LIIYIKLTGQFPIKLTENISFNKKKVLVNLTAILKVKFPLLCDEEGDDGIKEHDKNRKNNQTNLLPLTR
jgi:hypothetical protein